MAGDLVKLSSRVNFNGAGKEVMAIALWARCGGLNDESRTAILPADNLVPVAGHLGLDFHMISNAPEVADATRSIAASRTMADMTCAGEGMTVGGIEINTGGWGKEKSGAICQQLKTPHSRFCLYQAFISGSSKSLVSFTSDPVTNGRDYSRSVMGCLEPSGRPMSISHRSTFQCLGAWDRSMS